MKTYTYQKMRRGSLLWILFLLVTVSCKDDDVVIDSVWTNAYGEESVQITSSYVGRWVALKGSGFEGLQAIYCNGNDSYFNLSYVKDDYIVFQIPSEVPVYDEVTDENVRNTIQVVTNHGSAIYSDFIFKDPRLMPAVKSVSNSLPKVGQYIYISGNNLDRVQAIYFPGEIQVPDGDFELENGSTNSLKVKVPVGAGMVSGAIRLACFGEDIYTPAYMFYKQGVFISSFDREGDESAEFNCPQKRWTDIGRWPENGTHSASVADANMGNDSPEHYISLKKTKTGLMARDEWAGFFTFNVAYCFQKVIDNGDPQIQSSTPLENLALQFDVFMAQPWESGFIHFSFSRLAAKKDDKFSINYAAWKNGSAYNFKNAWRTMTIPLSNFPKILGDCPTLGDLIMRCKKGEGTVDDPEWSALFSFLNWNPNEDADHTMKDIDNFQINIANLRLVPYSSSY